MYMTDILFGVVTVSSLLALTVSLSLLKKQLLLYSRAIGRRSAGRE